MESPSSVLAGSRIALSSIQLSNANLILSEFTRAGLPPHVAMAAVANAYAESALDHNAVAGYAPFSGAGNWPKAAENSVGLFQLNSAAGAAGAGMSVAARKNPRLNTQRIIQVVKAAGADVLKAPNVYSATARFCTDIERPANAQTKAAERSRMAEDLFPEWAHAPLSALPPIKVALAGWMFGSTALVAALFAALVGYAVWQEG